MSMSNIKDSHKTLLLDIAKYTKLRVKRISNNNDKTEFEINKLEENSKILARYLYYASSQIFIDSLLKEMEKIKTGETLV